MRRRRFEAVQARSLYVDEEDKGALLQALHTTDWLQGRHSSSVHLLFCLYALVLRYDGDMLSLLLPVLWVSETGLSQIAMGRTLGETRRLIFRQSDGLEAADVFALSAGRCASTFEFLDNFITPFIFIYSAY